MHHDRSVRSRLFSLLQFLLLAGLGVLLYRLFFRPLLPVLAAGQTVLWVPGLCACEALRLASVPEGSIRLTFSRPFDPHQSKE